MAYQGQTAAAEPFCQLSDTAGNGTAEKSTPKAGLENEKRGILWGMPLFCYESAPQKGAKQPPPFDMFPPILYPQYWEDILMWLQGEETTGSL